jgi:hypothetical protein
LGVLDALFFLDLVVNDLCLVLCDLLRPLLPSEKMINLESGFISTILGYGTALFTDLSPVVILAIGLPVGFWIIFKVADMWYMSSEDNRAAAAADRRAAADRAATKKILDEF